LLVQTHVARQIVRSLGSIPSVVILSQDSFYKRHTPEELVIAHANASVRSATFNCNCECRLTDATNT
jgi:uridine kinase